METPAKCPACGEGTVRLVAKAGRAHPHRQLKNMPVPADFAIPTCDRCGEMWLTQRELDAMHAAMDRDYPAELERRGLSPKH